MKSIKNNYRFQKFYNKLNELGITKELKDNVETWGYENLNEVGRISPLIKSKMKSNGII
jgi:mitochondrial fission protein ELM1